MPLNNSQKGFSLPEVLVAVGLLGGVSMVTMKLVENQAANENQLKASVEVSKATSIVQSALNNVDRCKAMLLNVQKAASTENGTPVPDLGYPVNGGRKILLQDNKNYGHFLLRTGDIQLASSTMASPSAADLIINFRVRKNSTVSYGDTSNNANFTIIKKRIPVIVALDSSGRVKSCGPVVSDVNTVARKKFCESMEQVGGIAVWDDANERCVLKSMDCPWGQAPTQMTSLGGVVCKPLENIIDPNTIFDTTPCSGGTSYSLIYVSGKLRIDCIP